MTKSGKITIILITLLLIVVGVFSYFKISGKSFNSILFTKKIDQQDKNKTDSQKNSTKADNQTAKPESKEVDPPKMLTEKEKQKEKLQKAFKDIKVRAVYLSGSAAGNKAIIKHIIDLAKISELNAVVIDVKDDRGKVNYASDITEVKQNSAYQTFYDVKNVLDTLHENDIYVIGRIVNFKDPWMSTKRADLAIKRPNGQLWRENTTTPWLNPYNEEVWKYNISIAKEAVDKGFDEIQFDYVRFPDARKSDVNYGTNPIPKADAINNYLRNAYKEIHEGKGIPLSADIFAIVCESPGDTEGIGQVLEGAGKEIDYISPMIYPSHYANASHGMMGNGVGQSINGVNFTAPDLKPYEVVYNALLKTKNRITKVDGYKAKVRPYLQDFTASYIKNKAYYQTYGPEQVKQQKKAVYDAGFEEWILWDPSCTYTEEEFDKKKTQ